MLLNLFPKSYTFITSAMKTMKFIKNHKSNLLFAGAILILFLTPIGFQVKVFINRYVYFAPSEIPSEKQIKLQNYNWNLLDNRGNLIDFNAYKNKVIVVNFWATWCPPCVAEMPSFQEIYDSYKNDVVFLFVTNDKDEKVNSFMNSNNYSMPVFYEVSATPPQISSSSLPATFIIDKNGNIVLSKTGATNWNSTSIQHLLDKLIR